MDFSRFKSVKPARNIVRNNIRKAEGILLSAFFDKSKYEHGFYVKKDEEEYEVELLKEDLAKYNNLFSTPDNTQYKKWSIHKTNGNISLNDLDITFKYWSIIKPTLKIRGIIKGNKFILNHAWVNDKIDEEYNRFVAQDARKKD